MMGVRGLAEVPGVRGRLRAERDAARGDAPTQRLPLGDLARRGGAARIGACRRPDGRHRPAGRRARLPERQPGGRRAAVRGERGGVRNPGRGPGPRTAGPELLLGVPGERLLQFDADVGRAHHHQPHHPVPVPGHPGGYLHHRPHRGSRGGRRLRHRTPHPDRFRRARPPGALVGSGRGRPRHRARGPLRGGGAEPPAGIRKSARGGRLPDLHAREREFVQHHPASAGYGLLGGGISAGARAGDRSDRPRRDAVHHRDHPQGGALPRPGRARAPSSRWASKRRCGCAAVRPSTRSRTFSGVGRS